MGMTACAIDGIALASTHDMESCKNDTCGQSLRKVGILIERWFPGSIDGRVFASNKPFV